MRFLQSTDTISSFSAFINSINFSILVIVRTKSGIFVDYAAVLVIVLSLVFGYAGDLHVLCCQLQILLPC